MSETETLLPLAPDPDAPPAAAPAAPARRRANRRRVERNAEGDTRWIALEATDDTLLNWRVVGEVWAHSRDQAERRHWPSVKGKKTVLAVSEAAWQPHKKGVETVEKITTEAVVMPKLPSGPAAEDAEAEPPAAS